mgnify:FL=1
MKDDDNSNSSQVNQSGDPVAFGELYTVRDIKKLHSELLQRHFGSTLQWLKSIYPCLVGMQFVLYVFFVYVVGVEPEFKLELRNPMSLVAFTLFLSVSWPMVMVPVNRGIPPTFEECEFLLCAQYVQAHEGCDKAELIERLQAHRRVIQAQVLSNDLLRKQSWLLWFWCRVR